jgi:uncharacterized protein YndB with AHSA1/START domain
MTTSVSRSVQIAASPETVFEFLADPRQHARFDGSGTVKSQLNGPERLHEGATFGMRMRLGLPYVIQNTVVEFTEGRCIAWRHFGGHIWRYELEPVDDGTLVTETFDPSHAVSMRALKVIRAESRNTRAIEATLERLKELAESPTGSPEGF